MRAARKDKPEAALYWHSGTGQLELCGCKELYDVRFGGGAIEKCVYGKIGTESETVKPVQLSVMGAVGAQYNISNRVGLYVEPGVSYFFDDGSSIQTIRKENPCNFTLQAGIRLTY